MSTVTVHALSTGHLTLPERFFISPSDSEACRTVPSLSFLIQHESPSTNKTTRIVFDLGLRRSISLYPTGLQKHIATRSPMSTHPDVTKSLAEGGLTTDDIDLVILSHVHYDHVGYPRDFTNQKTKFIIGPGALGLLNGDTTLDIGSHSFFEADLLPFDRTIELPSPPTASSPLETQHKLYTNHAGLNVERYTSLPPFPHVVDLLPDYPGTLYIVLAPGHLPGHINLLCRISTSSLSSTIANNGVQPNSNMRGKYILLAGDACHDVRLFHGTHDIATWTDDQGKNCCIHHDIPAAKETIKRLQEVHRNGLQVMVHGCDNNQKQEGTHVGNRGTAEVEVVFAHNWEWEQDAKARGRFWPGCL